MTAGRSLDVPPGRHRLWESPDGTMFRVHLVELGQEASASGAPLRGVEFVPLEPSTHARFVVPEWEAVRHLEFSDAMLARLFELHGNASEASPREGT